MFESFVTLDNYQPGTLNGFGATSQGALDELNKALMTTGSSGVGTSGDGTPLRVQSLDAILKVITYTTDYLKLWRDIAKLPAYNTVEEFNQLVQYGGTAGAFIAEGALPTTQDSLYKRLTATVRFLATTRVISHPMTLVQSAVGDVIAREAENGTLWLLGLLSRYLYYSDSSIDPNAFDGIYKQMYAANGVDGQHIVDMRGQPLTPDVLEEAAQSMYQNYGRPDRSKLYLAPQQLTDMSRSYFANQRIFQDGSFTGVMGVPLQGYNSNYGLIPFEPDVFLVRQVAPPTTSGSGSAAAPATVTVVANAVDAASQFNSSTPGGTFYYFVTSYNSASESTPTAAGSATVANGGSATLTITRATGNPPASAYGIYRGTTNNSAQAQFLTYVADAGSGTTQNWTDENANLPGTNSSFYLDMDPDQSIAFKQLAPLMKMDLATIDTTYRFAILLYGMPIVYAPTKSVVFINVGKAS